MNTFNKLNPRFARLWQSGFELNTNTANIEWTATSGTPTLQTSTVRSGTYAGQVTAAGAAKGWAYQFAAAAGSGPFFARTYLNITTLPGIETKIFRFCASGAVSSGTYACYITLDSGGLLRLYNAADVQVGSASSALSTGTWYMVEMKYDMTPTNGSRIVEGRLDGSVFATTSALTQATTSSTIAIGVNLAAEADATAVLNFDDLAINDSTGSFQTGYPGSGKILHLKPNATGDVNTWTIGTPAGGSNFQKVNENTPDDGSSDVKSLTLNNEDLYNFDNSGIGSSDTVNVVAVNVRFSNDTAVNTTAMKLEIEKTGSGTKTQSSAIVPNSTTWSTNSVAIPHNPALITYQDPDSANWTQTTLDSLQAGYICTTGGLHNILVTTLWVSVDYTPSTVTVSTPTFFPFFYP